MKFHLGCGPNIKEGYVNVDAYVEHPEVRKHDILNMPYPDGSADEILAEHLFEHLPFEQEEQIFRECFRLLKTGGKLIVETPDMEWLCRQFVEAADDFKEFYRVGAKDHYFGNGRDPNHRWGMITTHFFGNQNGPGQYHKNGYTAGKFESIARLIGFSSCTSETFFSPKGAGAVRATLTK